jgi:formylglycine-generating enzyme required for sulfatase activity
LLAAVAFSALGVGEAVAQSTNPPDMIFVKGGTFKMGSNDGYADEAPVHSVTLSDFYIGKYEVTVAQYRQFCSATNHRFPGLPDDDWYAEHENAAQWQWNDTYPIVNISYFDAIAYCQWLSELTGEHYTLPTEAQWEYAARGGNKSKNYKYAGSNDIDEVAWYDETTRERGPRSVGRLKPNELGIYDMSGNAWEWCLDYWGNYSAKAQKDPTGPAQGGYKVIRGGSWYYVDDMAKLTSRDGPKPGKPNFNYGFRVVKLKK